MRRKHTISFKHAIDGIIYCIKTQPNYRFHLLATLGVIIFSIWLKIDFNNTVILLFLISLVLTTEMINTAIESITDLITTEYKQQAKIAKDVSAGMVLSTAFLAVIIGLVIFTPPLLAKFGV